MRYNEPSELDEALDELDEYGSELHVMAGGVSLTLMRNLGLIEADRVLGIRRIRRLHGIAAVNDGLRIGAMTTHSEVARNPDVIRQAPMLALAHRAIATPRIRNQGTIGGNLVHADPAQDPPPALQAYEGRVRVVSKARGVREIALEDLFVGLFETSVRDDELLLDVWVPSPKRAVGSAYSKFLPRTRDDYCTVSVATVVEGVGDEVVTCRVALGGVHQVPVRAHAVELAISEVRSIDELLQTDLRSIASEVDSSIDPMDDVRGSADYKRRMARVWVARSLRSAIEGLRSRILVEA